VRRRGAVDAAQARSDAARRRADDAPRPPAGRRAGGDAMSQLEKIVPEPLMSVVLLVLWLLLVQSLSPGQVILGLVLALVVPPLTAPLRPARLHARRADVALRYLMTVGYDVLKS